MTVPTTFTTTHATTGQSFERSHILQNPHFQNSAFSSITNPASSSASYDPAILALQKRLPAYAETPLVSLPDVARELGVGHVFVKDESTRFGSSSFKILGASWAVFCVLCERLGLGGPGDEVGIEEVRRAVALVNGRGRGPGIRIVTCSEGNWGRAVAYMGVLLGVRVTVYLSKNSEVATREMIGGQGEEVEVRIVDGSYDDAIAAVIKEGELEGTVLVMDTSWKGFEKVSMVSYSAIVPGGGLIEIQWVVEGYSTMLLEVDRQVKAACGNAVTLAISSTGVGSWTQSVVSHYQSTSPDTKVVAVEPETAACLMESLLCGKIIPITTNKTIMNGMNCGTVSSIAWPVLKTGVSTCVAVSDIESHDCVQVLSSAGLNIGPCGAAPLAAARKLRDAGPLQPDAVIVIFSTEGSREYKEPA